MNYDETTTTAAGMDRAWAALSAVTTLPQWTASMDSVTPLDGESLRAGRRYRIKQPGFPPAVWRVTEVRDGASFTWEAVVPGLRSVGYHRVSRDSDGTTRISIGVRQTGVLAGLMRLLTAARTRRYLRMEATGIKAAAEAGAPATSSGA